jgi:photosystem II stability/assembly factor-like uncharacterized protein
MNRHRPIYQWLAVSITVLFLMSCGLTQGIPFLSNPTGSPVPVQPSGQPGVTPPALTPAPGTSASPLPATPTIQTAASAIPPTTASVPLIAHMGSGQKIGITFIHMLDATHGWSIGGLSLASDHVFRTNDGGQTWLDVTPPAPALGQGSQWQALGVFLDTASAWVVYSPQSGSQAPQSVSIWYTHNGGASWQVSMLDTSAYQEFFNPSHLVFVDSQHGWMLAHVGVGMNHDYVVIAATADGGVSWQVLLDPVKDGGIQSCPKNGMAFADVKTGWLTPDCNGVDPTPHLFQTTDGGSTWARLDLPAPAGQPDLFTNNSCGMHSPAVFSALSGVFDMKCLDNATFKVEHDYLYRTSDGGKTWQVNPYPGGDVYFFSPQWGVALNQDLIQLTTDGGQHWTMKSQGISWNGQFSFVDVNTGWAVATNGSALALVKTVSSGGSWDGTWAILRPQVAP